VTTPPSFTPVSIGPTWQRDPKTGAWLLPQHTLGWEVLGWTAEYLRQPDGPDAGEPWRYTDEQARFILWWFAVDDAGRWLYRSGMLRRVKGWGLARIRLARRSWRPSSSARAGSLAGTRTAIPSRCLIPLRGC
jgi:hypothetical protein